VCSQIMALPPSLYATFLAAPPAKALGQVPNTAVNGRSDAASTETAMPGHPPVLFVAMERDHSTYRGMQLDVDVRTKLVSS
jgi:hypothetical protein